jgi:predicted nucleotidyltransferase
MIGELSLPDSLLSLRLYGSFARGDHDDLSDVDVLAVYHTPPSDDARRTIGDQLSKMFTGKVDLAEYSRPRIEEFYQKGHLFAWHLHAESKNLAGGSDPFFDTLGMPAPYKAAHSDAVGFLELLRSTRKEVDKSGVSLIYEAGMMYLASRNVAICASYGLNNRPDFSRWAIYNVCKDLGIGPQIQRSEYEFLMRCRFASIRGHMSVVPLANWIVQTCQSLSLACEQVIERAFEGVR